MHETARAKQAFADYLALPNRSLDYLINLYRDQHAAGSAVPTTNPSTLKTWSSAFGWQAKLAEIAEREMVEAEAREQQRIREIMDRGYALVHERVKLLCDLADVMKEDLVDTSRRWLRDVKSVGTGDRFERIDVLRFNAPEVEQLRGVLDDIAKEMGDRAQRHEYVMVEKKAQQLATERGLDPARVISFAEWLARKGAAG